MTAVLLTLVLGLLSALISMREDPPRGAAAARGGGSGNDPPGPDPYDDTDDDEQDDEDDDFDSLGGLPSALRRRIEEGLSDADLASEEDAVQALRQAGFHGTDALAHDVVAALRPDLAATGGQQSGPPASSPETTPDPGAGNTETTSETSGAASSAGQTTKDAGDVDDDDDDADFDDDADDADIDTDIDTDDDDDTDDVAAAAAKHAKQESARTLLDAEATRSFSQQVQDSLNEHGRLTPELEAISRQRGRDHLIMTGRIAGSNEDRQRLGLEPLTPEEVLAIANRSAPERRRDFFERTHTRLDTGEYVANRSIKDMSPDELAQLKQLGVEAFNAKQQEAAGVLESLKNEDGNVTYRAIGDWISASGRGAAVDLFGEEWVSGVEQRNAIAPRDGESFAAHYARVGEDDARGFYGDEEVDRQLEASGVFDSLKNEDGEVTHRAIGDWISTVGRPKAIELFGEEWVSGVERRQSIAPLAGESFPDHYARVGPEAARAFYGDETVDLSIEAEGVWESLRDDDGNVTPRAIGDWIAANRTKAVELFGEELVSGVEDQRAAAGLVDAAGGLVAAVQTGAVTQAQARTAGYSLDDYTAAVLLAPYTRPDGRVDLQAALDDPGVTPRRLRELFPAGPAGEPSPVDRHLEAEGVFDSLKNEDGEVTHRAIGDWISTVGRPKAVELFGEEWVSGVEKHHAIAPRDSESFPGHYARVGEEDARAFYGDEEFDRQLEAGGVLESLKNEEGVVTHRAFGDWVSANRARAVELFGEGWVSGVEDDVDEAALSVRAAQAAELVSPGLEEFAVEGGYNIDVALATRRFTPAQLVALGFSPVDVSEAVERVRGPQPGPFNPGSSDQAASELTQHELDQSNSPANYGFELDAGQRQQFGAGAAPSALALDWANLTPYEQRIVQLLGPDLASAALRATGDPLRTASSADENKLGFLEAALGNTTPLTLDQGQSGVVHEEGGKTFVSFGDVRYDADEWMKLPEGVRTVAREEGSLQRVIEAFDREDELFLFGPQTPEGKARIREDRDIRVRVNKIDGPGAGWRLAEMVVPTAYTIRHWSELSPSERAFSLGLDVLGLTPWTLWGRGAAGAVRGGTGVRRFAFDPVRPTAKELTTSPQLPLQWTTRNLGKIDQFVVPEGGIGRGPYANRAFAQGRGQQLSMDLPGQGFEPRYRLTAGGVPVPIRSPFRRVSDAVADTPFGHWFVAPPARVAHWGGRRVADVWRRAGDEAAAELEIANLMRQRYRTFDEAFAHIGKVDDYILLPVQAPDGSYALKLTHMGKSLGAAAIDAPPILRPATRPLPRGAPSPVRRQMPPPVVRPWAPPTPGAWPQIAPMDFPAPEDEPETDPEPERPPAVLPRPERPPTTDPELDRPVAVRLEPYRPPAVRLEPYRPPALRLEPYRPPGLWPQPYRPPGLLPQRDPPPLLLPQPDRPPGLLPQRDPPPVLLPQRDPPPLLLPDPFPVPRPLDEPERRPPPVHPPPPSPPPPVEPPPGAPPGRPNRPKPPPIGGGGIRKQLGGPGRYAREVAFQTGEVAWRVDLVDGTRSSRRQLPPRTAAETFRVTRYSAERPQPQGIDIGFGELFVTRDEVRFRPRDPRPAMFVRERERNPFRDRSFRVRF